MTGIEREHAEDCFKMGERAAEDAEAADWVREHGGLSHVKDIYNDLRAVVERLGIEWSESELHGLMDALDRRLMLEGMEWLVEAWPRFEDDAPVKFGDVVSDGNETGRVYYVTLDTVNPVIIGFTDEEPDRDPGTWLEVSVSDGERVRRPAPKILDADGEEIEVGDDLYSVEGGLKFHVSSIDRVSGKIATEAMFALDKWADPAMYTHRAPALAERDR